MGFSKTNRRIKAGLPAFFLLAGRIDGGFFWVYNGGKMA
jgi:hypothetical protein